MMGSKSPSEARHSYMRALQMVGWQQDPELREIPMPVSGPGEVLVRVAAAGVCHSDIHVLYEFTALVCRLAPSADARS